MRILKSSSCKSQFCETNLDEIKSFEKLELKHFYGCFKIWGLGIGFAFIAVAWEMLNQLKRFSDCFIIWVLGLGFAFIAFAMKMRNQCKCRLVKLEKFPYMKVLFSFRQNQIHPQ